MSLAALLRTAWGDPMLRMIGGVILLFGAYAASLGIHQSLLATRTFGLSDGAYAWVLAGITAASVGSAVAIGVATDRHPWRRRLAAGSAALALLGTLLVWLAEAPWAFLLAHLLLLPPAASLLGQSFAVVRLATQGRPPEERAGLLAVMRSLFAVPFVLVLPLWALVLRDDAALPLLYPALAGLLLVLVALILRAWPPDGTAPWVEARSGLGVLASLREIGQGPVLGRTALIGAAQAGGAAGGIVIGLIFAGAGRAPGDVGLFFAAFVVVEIGVTLMLGRLSRVPRLALIALGAAGYALYLGLLPFLAGS